MKKILILLLFITGYCEAQTIISQPYLFQKYITVKDSAAISGRLRIPTDTLINKQGIAQVGANLYTGNGAYWTLSNQSIISWNSIIGKPTYFLSKYDSSTDIKDSIQKRWDSSKVKTILSLKVNYTDSSTTYYTKYRSDTSRSNIYNAINTKGNITGNSPTITSSVVPITYWNGTNKIGYTNGLTVDTIASNLTANNFYSGFISVAASGTQITLTTLSVPSYLITGSGGQTIKLPNATTLPNGAIFTFNNNQSSGTISVNNNSNTLVVSIPSGGYTSIVLNSNATAAGSWDWHFSAPSAVQWSTNTFNLGNASITNATWNGSTISSGKLDTTTRFTGIATIGKAYNDSLVLATATNTKLAITDTLAMLNNRLSSISLNSSGVIHNSPITFNRLGGAWTGTMSLATQSPYRVFWNNTSSTLAPAFNFLDSNAFGGGFATQVRAAQTGGSSYTAGRGITLTGSAFGLDTTKDITYTGSNYFNNTITKFLPTRAVQIDNSNGIDQPAIRATGSSLSSFNFITNNGILDINTGTNTTGIRLNTTFSMTTIGGASYGGAATILSTLNGRPLVLKSTANADPNSDGVVIDVATSCRTPFKIMQATTYTPFIIFNGSGAAGNVGINTTSDDATNKLQVNGSAKATAFNSNATQTTVSTGLSAGSIVFSTPFNGSSYKKVIAYCNGVTGTLSTPYTISFTNTPVVTFASAGLTASTLTTTSFNITGVSVNSGFVIIEGY